MPLREGFVRHYLSVVVGRGVAAAVAVEAVVVAAD